MLSRRSSGIRLGLAELVLVHAHILGPWPSTSACARSPASCSAIALTLVGRHGRLPRGVARVVVPVVLPERRHGDADRPRHRSREQRRAGPLDRARRSWGSRSSPTRVRLSSRRSPAASSRARWRNGGGSGRSSSCTTTSSSAATAASAGASPRSSGGRSAVRRARLRTRTRSRSRATRRAAARGGRDPGRRTSSGPGSSARAGSSPRPTRTRRTSTSPSRPAPRGPT